METSVSRALCFEGLLSNTQGVLSIGLTQKEDKPISIVVRISQYHRTKSWINVIVPKDYSHEEFTSVMGHITNTFLNKYVIT